MSNQMSESMTAIESWLSANKVTQVQCVIGDHTGVARGKILPVDKFISEEGCRLGETI